LGASRQRPAIMTNVEIKEVPVIKLESSGNFERAGSSRKVIVQAGRISPRIYPQWGDWHTP